MVQISSREVPLWSTVAARAFRSLILTLLLWVPSASFLDPAQAHAAPTLLASIDSPGSADATDVAIDGAYAYCVTANNVTAGAPELSIFNIADPHAPVAGGVLDLGVSPTKVRISGRYAYITTRSDSEELVIVDISNPRAPVESTRFNAGDKVFGVASLNGNAYLAGANNAKEIQIVNTNASTPDPPPAPPSPVAVAQPNIIVIMADDQRWDSVPSMPTVMSEFVNTGLVFNNAFVTTSLCSPSRAAFLTGQYSDHAGVTTNLAPSGGASAFVDTSTVATWLQAAGYRTALIGKYFNEYSMIASHVPPGWDNWQAVIDDPAAPTSYFDYALNENGTVVHYGSNPCAYSTDVLRNKAVAFVQATAHQPFFLVFAPIAPHKPATPAPRHEGSYATLSPFRPPSWQELDISDKPSSYAVLKLHWDHATIADNDRLRIAQFEALRATDDAVRAILDAVDAAGITERTLVVYTSDNGLPQGEHWQSEGRKNCPYEECIRVPLLVRYPAVVTAPRREDRLVLNIDLAPTFAELAGLPPPASADGRSLVKLLRGTETNWRTDILVEHWAGSVGRPVNASVRTDRWKYIRTYDRSFEELYDLEADPFEMTSVTANNANGPILNSLRARLQELQSH